MAKPNIVLLSIDCLRYDRCGFAGYHRDTTPNIDSLAAESQVFTSAYAPGPRTAESVPGILSGRLSFQCDSTDELSFKAIPDGAETIGSYLQSYDYETFATVANPQLSPARNFDTGFDRYTNLRIERDGDRFASSDDTRQGASVLTKYGKQFRTIAEELPIDASAVAFLAYRVQQKRSNWPTVAGETVMEALVEALPDEGPFFGWTHLNDVHAPIHPDRARDGGLTDKGDLQQYYADSKRERHTRTAQYELNYDSAIRYVDSQIGKIVEWLKATGNYDDTAVIVTADHGEALYDRGIYGHAAGNEQRLYESDRDYLYPELLHVPLIVKPPSGSHETIDTPFSLTWLHEIFSGLIDEPTGDFPSAVSCDHYLDIDAPVLADTITEQGHTIAATDADQYIVTDGTTPRTCDRANWHFRTRGAIDHSLDRSAFDDLAAVVEDAITDPDDVRSLRDSISDETMDMLSKLGYR